VDELTDVRTYVRMDGRTVETGFLGRFCRKVDRKIN